MNKYLKLAIIWIVLIPVFYLFGQQLFSFTFWALGYESGQVLGDASLIDRLIVIVPVGTVMLFPCLQAIRYGFAAKRTVGRKAFLPTLLAALAGSFIFFILLVSFLGI
jgi:hypothetical protein